MAMAGYLNFRITWPKRAAVKAIDLFCGAGGLTHGLRRAGCRVVLGMDVDSTVGETYRRNNPGTRFVAADLRSVTDDDIRMLAGGTPSRELLLAGCAPCPAFSKHRHGRGLRERSDGTLLLEFGRFVRALRPRAVLMENVPGIASVPGFSSLRRFLRTLRDCGYEPGHGVLNARDFGVPQYRRRYVLLAVRDAPIPLPSPGPSGECTVRDAIGHFPEIEAGEAHRLIPNHRAAGLSPLNMKRIQATPSDGGALISAVREAGDGGKGRAYTKQETLKRNRNLALKLMYSTRYAFFSVKGHWGQHQEPETSDRAGSRKYDIMDRSFFVLGSGPRFEPDIVELGRYFEQDSVLIMPRGSWRNEAKAYLVRTNDCPNSRKGIPRGKSDFESIRLDQDSTGWISFLRTGGRPFRLEDEILAHHIPPHGYGNIFLSQEAKRDWKEAESLFLGGFRPESTCRLSDEFNYHACGRTDESKNLLERTKDAFEVSEFKEMTGSSKTKHSLDRQGRPQVLLTLEGAFNSADAVHIVCNEADDAFDLTFLSGVARQFAGYDHDVISEHKGLPFEDIKPVFQEETRFYLPFATKEG